MSKYKFRDNVKKSEIDDFIEKYTADIDSKWHVADCVRSLSVDEQLDLFHEKILSLFKFAYKNDLRVTMCRTKHETTPYDFTELTIEVPNELTNVIPIIDGGVEDNDPLVEIILTIQKINSKSFIPTVDNFGDSTVRLGCAEIWVSYDTFNYASVGIECDGGVALSEDKFNRNANAYTPSQTVVDENMILPVDVCIAVENILKDVHDTIKKDPKWYSWFILQGIDIDEVFLWDLSH